jgi:hypothetical protein
MFTDFKLRRRLAIAGLAVAITAAFALPAAAQRQRVSPHEKTEGVIGGKTITIEYGRPSLKGRELLGNLIPFDKVWRLGADEATKLTTPVDIEIGSLKVPAGTYSLFMLVGQEGDTQLIVNKVADQWGAFKYDAAQDLGRVPIMGSRDNAVKEMLTITIESTGEKTGRIKFAWGDGEATASLRVL